MYQKRGEKAYPNEGHGSVNVTKYLNDFTELIHSFDEAL